MSPGFSKVFSFRWLFVTAVLLVFIGSYSVLSLFGLSVGDVEGSPLKRFHPSLYLAMPYILILLMWRVLQNFQSGGHSLNQFNGFKKSFILFSASVAAAVFFAAIGMSNGSVVNTINTFLLSVIILAGLASLPLRTLGRVGFFILVIMLINSAIGVYEKHTGERLLKYMIGTTEQLKDPRPTAIFSHPLNNALLTGLVVIHILYSKSLRLPIYVKSSMLAVHFYAMACFGGRTATVVTIFIVAFDYLRQITQAIFWGGGFKSLSFKTVSLFVATALGAIAFSLGYFDDFISRFTDDGGSADVRWNALALIKDIDASSVSLGVNSSQIESYLGYYDLFTIEFSWLYLMLTHGTAITALLAMTLVALFVQISKVHKKPVGYMCFLFLVVTAGYTSLASASLTLTQLFVMIFTLSACEKTASHSGSMRTGV